MFQSGKLYFLFCYMGLGSPNAHVPLQLPSYCLLHLKDDPFVPVHWVFVIPCRDWFLSAVFFVSKSRNEKVTNIKSRGKTSFFSRSTYFVKLG